MDFIFLSTIFLSTVFRGHPAFTFAADGEDGCRQNVSDAPAAA